MRMLGHLDVDRIALEHGWNTAMKSCNLLEAIERDMKALGYSFDP